MRAAAEATDLEPVSDLRLPHFTSLSLWRTNAETRAELLAANAKPSAPALRHLDACKTLTRAVAALANLDMLRLATQHNKQAALPDERKAAL